MRTFTHWGLIICSVVATSQVSAHDFTTDLWCSFTDIITHDNLLYTFANNSANADGSFGGTFVETSRSRNNKPLIAPIGSRPIWIWSVEKSPVKNILTYRDRPTWRIETEKFEFAPGKRYVHAPASFIHNDVVAAGGWCYRQTKGGWSAQTVPDIGGD